MVTSQRSQKPKVCIATQTELTWPREADTPVPVKTNSQTMQTHSNQNSAKNTGIPLLLHQEVAEVQMLQYPLPVKAVRGTLNPLRPLHLQKDRQTKNKPPPPHTDDPTAMYSRYGVLDVEGGGNSDAE